MAQTFTASRDKGAVQTYDGVGRADKGAVEAVLVQDPAKCYNALFGKGNYESADASLEAHWELQDDAASTTVVDSSGNGRDGVLTGAGNTSASTTTGPTSWLPKAINLDGTDDWVDITGTSSSTFMGTQKFSILAWSKFDTVASWEGPISIGRDFRPIFLCARLSGANTQLHRDGLGSSPSLGANVTGGGWFHLGGSFDGSYSKHYVNGAFDNQAADTANLSDASPKTWRLGRNLQGSTDYYMDGKIAGVSVFTRALTDAEFTEAYSGPEPYLSGTAPTITGTIARGSEITLNAGTWNGQSNGTVYYTYELYSYSDTSGTDERLEKRITTTLTTQKVILRGSAIVGRYLRAVVTASNDGGFDPLEVYSTAYTSAVGAGSDPTYESYNALFGKGRHLEDPSLEGHWPMNEASGLITYDASTNGLNGNIGGTPSLNQAGPTTWMSKSYSFSGAAAGGHISFGDVLNAPSAFTQMAWVRTNSTSVSNKAVVGRWIDNNGYMLWVSTNKKASVPINAATHLEGTTDVSTVSWHHIAGTYDGATAKVYANGSSEGSLAESVPNSASSTSYYIGRYQTVYFDGYISGVSHFSRALSSAEIANGYSGPEPLNITAPSISGTLEVGQTLTASSGTWDGQSNVAVVGSVQVSYQWYRADDASGTNEVAIGGATSSTYTLQAADEGKYLRVRARGTNDGGYDEAEDTYSAYTAVVAGSGGGQTGSASDSITFTDSTSAVLATAASVSESITFSDTASATGSGAAEAADTITVSDSVSAVSGLSDYLSESIVFGDSASAVVGTSAVAEDAITLSDSLSTSESLSDTLTLTLTDSVDAVLSTSVSIADTLTLTDTALGDASGGVSVVDTLTLTDAASAVVTSSNSLSDTLTLTDSVSAVVTTAEALSDALMLTDDVSGAVTTAESISDVLSLSDAVTGDTSGAQSVIDTLTLSDASEVILGAVGGVVDTITLDDTVSASVVTSSTLSDTLTLTDSTSSSRTVSASCDDTITFTDSAETTASGVNVIDDTILVTDNVAVIMQALIDSADALSLSDETTAVVKTSVSLNDGVMFSDIVLDYLNAEFASRYAIYATQIAIQ